MGQEFLHLDGTWKVPFFFDILIALDPAFLPDTYGSDSKPWRFTSLCLGGVGRTLREVGWEVNNSLFIDGWRLNHPSENMIVKLDIFPKIVVKIANLWNNHVDYLQYTSNNDMSYPNILDYKQVIQFVSKYFPCNLLIHYPNRLHMQNAYIV